MVRTGYGALLKGVLVMKEEFDYTTCEHKIENHSITVDTETRATVKLICSLCKAVYKETIYTEFSPENWTTVHSDYSIEQARYSKGNYLVKVVHNEAYASYKNRADRLIGDGLNCRWTHREGGYIASSAKVRKFIRMYTEGYDASSITGRLIEPKPKQEAS